MFEMANPPVAGGTLRKGLVLSCADQVDLTPLDRKSLFQPGTWSPMPVRLRWNPDHSRSERRRSYPMPASGGSGKVRNPPLKDCNISLKDSNLSPVRGN